MMEEFKYFAFISQRIGSLFGLHYPENQWNNMMRCLSKAAIELKYSQSTEAIFDWLSQAKLGDQDVKILTKHLTIGETYFFREKVALDLFQKKVIPELILKSNSEKKTVRIWSAGCSSGEEPYSIAILLKEMLPDIQNWDILIHATDLNQVALDKAIAGIYTPWSFRETSEIIKNKYFTFRGKEFHINEEIKQMVHFSKLNLVTDEFPSTSNNTHQMDVIFCRNVLMYFAPETIRSISRRFHQALNEEAWLITSQVELNDEYFSPFLRVMYEKGIFYQKKEKIENSNNIDFHGISELQKNKTKKLENRKIPVSKPRRKFEYDSTSISTKDAATALSRSNKVQVQKQEPQALFDASNYSECALICKQLIEKKGIDKSIVLLLVRSLANLGKLDEAIHWVEQLMKIDATNTEIRYLYATILIEKQEWELAEKALLSTIYLDPSYLAAQLSMCNVLKQLGKKKNATKQFEALLSNLQSWNDTEIVPDLDGMTAGRLRQMVKMLM